ncbi:hypothetical protein LMG28690_04317 [Paraburkholderia caffeinilytica]|nr:hypothetical protein LMG28690_04317 [Paraburkholderia caffeinilytica]
MKNDQAKRRPVRRRGDIGFTFPAAITSIVRCALCRVGNEIHGPSVWQFALHAVRGLFPRNDSSDPIRLHALACTRTRPA